MEIFDLMRAKAANNDMPDWWLELSYLEQKAYLDAHPGSHLVQTSFPVESEGSAPSEVNAETIASEHTDDTATDIIQAGAGTPEDQALDTALDNEAAQSVVAADANGTPLEPTEDEKQKITGATFAAIMLLAAVSGALEETFPIEDYAQKAANWLCVRAGYKPIYNADGDLAAMRDLYPMRDDPTAQTSHTPEGFTDEEMRLLRNHSSSATASGTASGVDRDALKQFYVRFAVACVKHSMKEGKRG